MKLLEGMGSRVEMKQGRKVLRESARRSEAVGGQRRRSIMLETLNLVLIVFGSTSSG
jgi:hypothetical protein